jgi:flagellar protein FlaG
MSPGKDREMIPSAQAGTQALDSARAATLPLLASGAEAPPTEVSRPASTVPVRPAVDFDPERVRKNLQDAVEHLNKQLIDSGRSLGFRMDDALNRPIVTVRNSNTGEVVRQIPSEAVIRVAHTLDELKGLLYDATT